MRKIIKTFTILLIYGMVFLLESYSRGDIMSGLQILMFLIVIALLITLCATVFFKSSFKQRLLKGLPLSFIATGTVYLFAYFLQTFLILLV